MPPVERGIGRRIARALRRPDGSILFGGPRPETDTYTVTLETELQAITAVRLEVLTDASLPHEGPGRQDNGNLHLTEFKLTAAPWPAAMPVPVALASAVADFNQDGWAVALAIDGKPETAWGIYPEVGKPHSAIFVLREPLKIDGGPGCRSFWTTAWRRPSDRPAPDCR